MIALRISLFGPMHVFITEDSSEVKMTHTTQILLAYLLLKRGRFVSREELAGLFWGDYSERNAHDCLNTALWRLRCQFRPTQASGEEYLVTNYQGAVEFNCPDCCWLDIAEFEAQWKRVGEISPQFLQQESTDLDRVTAIYQGDLLEGFYEDWIVSQRERFRLMYLNTLSRLMNYFHARNEPGKSLDYGQRILALDPLREDVHRDMMKLYLELGQRAMAVYQYNTCCKILDKELNIGPMRETQALYEVALSASGSPATTNLPVSSLGDGGNEGFQADLVRIQMAVESLDLARSALCQAIQALERRF